jgi:hypothetical protein
MPEIYDMLTELRDMVDDEEIHYDRCEHDDPAGAELLGQDDPEFCPVCFIVNLSDHVSPQEPEFSEETTERQREVIESLWERYAN